MSNSQVLGKVERSAAVPKTCILTDEWIPFKKTKYPPTPETLETKCGKNVSLRSAIMRMSLINQTKEGSLLCRM